MKFNKPSQLLLVSAASLLAAGVMTACGTLTVDFVYVASSAAAGPNNYGEIDVFEINSVSGAMRQIPTSPFPSGGRNPVAEAVSPDNTNLYVVNRDDSSIVQFLIGNDGKLYPQNTYDTTGAYSIAGTVDPSGIFPLAIAANGANLFVVNTYQPLPICSPAEPCSGSVAVYPILTATLKPPAPADSLGLPVANPNTGANYWPLTLLSYSASGNSSNCQTNASADVITPTAVNVLKSGADLYVTAYDMTVTPNAGYVFGFSVSSGGVLAPLNCGVPFPAGVHPSAIASDSTTTGTYLYVTDSTNGNVLGYKVSSASATAGLLTSLPGSPFPSGNQPSAIVVDPTYPYAYVANALDGNVSAYSISDGTLLCNQVKIPAGAICSIGAYDAGIQPVAIGIDPSTNHFVFTVNFLGDNVSDFELSATAGTLINTQRSPYTANAQPTAVAAVPHGSPPK